MMSMEERYERDPIIHCLVNTLVTIIRELQLTPTEVRECAVFACVMEEQTKPYMRFNFPRGEQ